MSRTLSWVVNAGLLVLCCFLVANTANTVFASLLTRNATVAFVLGSVLCAGPVFVGHLAPSSEFVQSLSLERQLRDFNMGIIPLTGLAYFLSLTVLFLIAAVKSLQVRRLR